MTKKQPKEVKLSPHRLTKADLKQKSIQAHDTIFYGNGDTVESYKALDKGQFMDCVDEVTKDIEDEDIVDSEKLNKCIAKKVRPITSTEFDELQTRLGILMEKSK